MVWESLLAGARLCQGNKRVINFINDATNAS